MSIWLDAEDVYELTDRRKPSAQARVLTERKIPFIMGAKRPLVRKDWDQGTKGRSREPRLELVNGAEI